MIYIVDNGEHYEENRLYFIEAEPGQIEALIEDRKQITGECSYFIVGTTQKIEWFGDSQAESLKEFLDNVHWEEGVNFEKELRKKRIGDQAQ